MKFHVSVPVLAAIVMLLGAPVFGANVFLDIFDSGPSPMWGNERGDWYGHDGAYDARYPSNSPATVSLLPINLTDFAIDVDVNGISDGGIWLRSRYAGGSVSGVLLVTGGVSQNGSGFYWLIVHNDGHTGMLNPSPALFHQGDNVHVRIVVSGDTYSCYLNGSLTACTTLANADFPSGQVGLCDSSGQTFDNFSVATGVEVSRGVATKIQSAWDPIMAAAGESFRFTFAGRVTTIDSDNFWLDDGSRQPIEVIAPGYTGITSGDWVRATGTVTREGGDPVLMADDLTYQGYQAVSRWISGSVLAEGVGVSGAWVCPAGGEGCYTDSNGYYSVHVPRGWTGIVSARHDSCEFDSPDLWFANVTVDQTNQDFQATRLYTISGHVTKADGGPVSDVYVYPLPDTHTDSNGYYSFRVPAHSSLGIWLQHDFYTFAPDSRDYTDVTADQTNQDFAAIAKPLISGHCRTADGTPVSGAELWPNYVTCYSDSNGYYAMPVWPGWNGTLYAGSQNYIFTPASRDYTDVTTDVSGQDFEATAAPVIPVISGHIRTSDGTPVGGVRVYSSSGPEGYTDPDGYYEIRTNPGWSGTLTARHDFYTFSPESRQYTNVTADLPDQDLLAIENPIISGYVRTAGGTPVIGAQLMMYGNSYYSDSNGHYAVHVSPGFSGTLYIASDDLYTFTPESRDYANVTTDVPGQDYEATAKAVISGHIRTAGGTPVSNVYVQAQSGEYDYVDSDGYYAVHVPQGWSGTLGVSSHELYTFSPESRDYANVTADIPDQDILAIDRPIISGYVRTADGTPPTPGSVEVYASSGENSYTGPDGYYLLRVPYGWSGTVSAYANWGYHFTPAARTYSSVTTYQANQNFTAIPNPVISGYVRTADGTPIANVQIQVHTDTTYPWVNTDSNGFYSVMVPFDCSATVTVSWHDLYTFSPQNLDYTHVTSDRPNSDFEAIAMPVISGYVRTADGIPVVDAYVEGSYTDSNGYYAIRVPTGWSGMVSISSSDLYTFAPQNHQYTNVTADQPYQNFAATTKPIISGRVRTADGTPVEFALVIGNGYCYTDSDGHYSIPVPTGWSGTVTVGQNDLYTFVPESREYTNVVANQTNQDYEAIAKPIISGYVKTLGGTPVQYASIFTDNGNIYANTNADGYYAFRVPTGWSGSAIISPSYDYTYSPDSHQYTNVTADQPDQNFTAIPNPIISGYVRTAGGSPVSDANLSVSDIGSYQIHSDGYYAAYVPMGWSGTVSASHALYTFSPESREYTNVTTDQPNQDFQAIPKPIISGYVRTAGGTPVEGARIYTDNWDLSVSTDHSGYYSLAVPTGWSGNAFIWWHPLYTFSPESHGYANVTADRPNQDFEATAKLIISGHMRMADGTPIQSAYAEADGSGVANTDSDGFYSFGEPAGWSGTVTVSHTLYTFAPESRSYENLAADQGNQDYEATVKPIISGYVRTADGTPIKDVLIDTGATFQYAYTDYDGHYWLPVPAGWSGTITTRHYTYSCSPESRTYTNVTADQPDQNYEAITKPTISGYVTAVDNTPVANLMLYTVGGEYGASTDSSGHYSLPVPVGWSGTISPWDYIYTFAPDSREYTSVTADQPDQNYEATPKPADQEPVGIAGR